MIICRCTCTSPVTAAGEHEQFRRLRERLHDLQAKGLVLRVKSRPPNDTGQVGLHKVWLQHPLVVESHNLIKVVTR